MDSTAVSNINQSNDESNKVKLSNEVQTHQKMVRSASHGRPPSATGGRSKIPTNANQNRPTSSIANTQITTCTQDDSVNPITQGNATRRLARSHNSTLLKSKGQGSAPSGMHKRWLENQFRKENKRYLSFRKELDEKQKSAQKMYDDMLQLREKLIADGGDDPGKIEEIKFILDDSHKQSDNQNPCRGSGESGFATNAAINKEFISNVKNDLKNQQNGSVILCEDVMKKYSDTMKWLESLGKISDKFCQEMNQHIDKYKKDIEIFNRRLENSKKFADEFHVSLDKNVMMMWNEIEALRSRIKHQESISDDVINDLRAQLNAKMEKFDQLNEKKAITDNELIKAKARIQSLEARIDADEVKMGQLQSHLKNLENLLKQKDVNLEYSTRDLHKSLKHSEETIVNLEIQRDNLEQRLHEMRENLERESKWIEKSPRILETNRSIEKEHDKEMKKKVKELETLVETLHGEVTTNKDLIVKLQNEKSSSEMQLKEQLGKEQAQNIKLKESYEQLKGEHQSIQQKLSLLDAVTVTHENDFQYVDQDSNSLELIKSTEVLHQETADMKRKIKDLESQLQQQSKNLEMKNQMISYLKCKQPNGNNSNARQVDKEMNSKAELLQDLHATLDKKQMQITHLENVLKQMENQELRNQEQRIRYEKRIAQLEYDTQTKSKDCRYVLDLPITHLSLRQNEIEKALELEKKYQRLRKGSRQMEYFYHKLMEFDEKNVPSRDTPRHSRGSNRDKDYTCHSHVEPKCARNGHHARQIVDQCGRELGDSFNSNVRRRVGCWSHSPQQIIKKKMPTKGEFDTCVHH